MGSYDEIAEHYDAWIGTHDKDVKFYVEQARTSGGPIVELGVGTGRIAVPTAQAGVRVIGIDASKKMLELCARRAAQAGVSDLVDLRQGDFRSPPVADLVPLVTCPRLSFLHLHSDSDRRQALHGVRRILRAGGRFVFDVFAPSESELGPSDIEWFERAPGLWTKDDYEWDARVMHITVRSPAGKAALTFSWISRDEWRRLFEACGFSIHACYGWFDLSACDDGMHSIWVIERLD